MRESPETRKSAGAWLVMDETPENIERNAHWRCGMTRNEMYDRPEIPPLRGAGIYWSWLSAGKFKQGGEA